MSAIKILINNSVKENFYKKKKINILTIFSFLIKVMWKFYKNDTH